MSPKGSNPTDPHLELPAEEGGESLLHFNKEFDFKKFVRERLVPSQDNDLAQTVLSSARLVGQEKDGGVLFTWDTVSPSEDKSENDTDEVVTYVGLYSPNNPRYRTLYRHETRVHICAASVNFERTLLAFILKERRGMEITYEPSVAEIQPQGRVFTLNIGGKSFRKIQFLHLDSSTPKSRVGKNLQYSRLLVVIPHLYMCVYTFKMQILREGAVLTQQPEQELIAENFSWYQWDPHFQQMYYARFESTCSPVQASVSGRNSLVLHCVNFTSSSYQLLLTLSLPLPYNERVYSSSSTYYHSPLAFTMPVREMNLQVLRRRDGFWCICLQHCTGVAAAAKGSSFEYEEPDAPQGGKIDYSVYIVHNGYVLYGQVPLPIPSIEAMYIHFMLIGCFVAAYIPGFMLHLLNVGPRTDPCHHLAFGPDLAPEFPVTEPSNVGAVENIYSWTEGPVLSSAVSSFHLDDNNTAIMDCNSEVVYECSLNVASFLALFKRASNSDLRESLLHLMIVGFRDHRMALSMIEHVCQTPMSLADHCLFAEFMLASTFANVYFDCKRYIAKQLPLTISPTFRGEVYKNEDHSKLALLKISPLQNLIKQLLVQSDQKLVAATMDDLLNYQPTSEQPLEMLCFTAITSQPTDFPRIGIRSALAEKAEFEKSAQTSSPQATPVQPPKGRQTKKTLQESMTSSRRLRGALLTLTRRTPPSRQTHSQTRSGLMESVNFLEPDEHQTMLIAGKVNAIQEQLLNIIAKKLTQRSKSTVYNSITLYLGELEKQSCTLLLLIWQSLGFTPDNHLFLASIHRKATTEEQILFGLLEAYQLAHMEIGMPVPAGFHTLFSALGFVCLHPSIFLQYLRNGVFVPTHRFVHLLLDASQQLDKSFIHQIICHMDQPLADYAFEQWHDPTVEQLKEVH